MAEMAAGTFSLTAFYERRIRRILPALLVMLLAVTALAYLYFVPSEIEAYAVSLLAALSSVSNMLFWHEAGYFDAPSAFKPLLHTWSLGVEEQFYIFFPLFLFFLRRWFPAQIRAAIWTVTIASFALACFWVRKDPTAAFFFAPLRAWELLIGNNPLAALSTVDQGCVGEKYCSRGRHLTNSSAGPGLQQAHSIPRARGPTAVLRRSAADCRRRVGTFVDWQHSFLEACCLRRHYFLFTLSLALAIPGFSRHSTPVYQDIYP